MIVEIINPDFIFEDDRGSLVQLVRSGFNQVNVITSKSGVIRGGHHHNMNEEAFYIISGSLKLDLKKDDISETHIFKSGDMFKIPKLVTHSFEFLEDTLLVSMYDLGVELENGEKDIISD